MPGYWVEDGEVIEDLTAATDDDPIWDECPEPHRLDEVDLADLHRKAVRESST